MSDSRGKRVCACGETLDKAPLTVLRRSRAFLFGVIAQLWHLVRTLFMVDITHKSMRPQLTDSTPRILGTGRADGTYSYKQDFLAEKLPSVTRA